MAAKDIHRFSTISRDALWWRANITKCDLGWVRQNLGHSLDRVEAFKVVPPSRPLVDGPVGNSWNGRVVFVEGENAPRVHISLGEKYDYRQEYERARNARDPYLSPHGLFRRLENGRHVHALEFMQQFGALTWESKTLTGRAEWVNLSDFWDKHARFVGVSMLWEARSDDQLKQAWKWIYSRRDLINRVPPAPLGHVPLWKVDTYSPPPELLPWEREEGFESSVDDLADFRILRRYSLEVIQRELNMHTSDCRQIWLMDPVENASQEVSFRPARGFASLWGAIWDLFGQDASTLKHTWRSCLECGRLFYPKDRRSVCCTTEHQALWSKRKWARENRMTKPLSKPRVSRRSNERVDR